MPTLLDLRQSVLRAALSMTGSAAGATADTIFPLIDAEIAKLYEDRNVLLTDGGTITFTGTQVQFSSVLNITLNSKISGAVPQVISLGSTSQNFVNSGDMWVAVLNRTAGTATTSIVTVGSALPAVSSANEEVFLIAKRVDATDGTQRLYWRNGFAMNAGQSLRLGQGGGGGLGTGSGTDSDLDSLQFRASFNDPFAESDTSSVTSINASGTNAIFNAAKSMYTLSYDASQTITGASTTIAVSAAPAFTVAVGDVVVANGYTRKITAIASQTSYTIEAAFPTALSAAACVISQCVYTLDIYNLPVDGVSLATEFGTATFSEIQVDYKDNATSGSNIFTPGTGPFISFVGSNDNINFTSVNTRTLLGTTQAQSTMLPSAGTSCYLRFFANESSGSGTVNLIQYKCFMQKSVTAAGTNNIVWSASATTNNSTTPINCTVSVVGGKTQINIIGYTYPMAVLSGQEMGSLQVAINGQIINRFVSGSTPSGDGYYIEVSPNIIQLDRDYSSQQLTILISYNLQVIDSSTTNTTSISAINTHQLQNVAINGAFDFWQRGTNVVVATATQTYQADRWFCNNASGSSATYSQTTGAVNGSKYGASLTFGASATSNSLSLTQVVENSNTLQFLGQTASVGIWVKGNSLTNQVTISIGYALAETKTQTIIASQAFTVNGAGFTYCSLAGVNIGTLPTSTGTISVSIQPTGASSGSVYASGNGFIVEQCMLNVGGVIAPFSRAGKNIGEELMMCQRYYEKSYDVATIPGTATIYGRFITFVQTTVSTLNGINLPFNYPYYMVSKRNQPTVTLYNAGTGTSGSWQIDGPGNMAVQSFPEGNNHFLVQNASGSTQNIGPGNCEGHWTADADI